jgi:LPS sulfotransferase NodH
MSSSIEIPSTSYLVCGIPRSGTSLLCRAVRSTGVAGRPEEYFWRGDDAFWITRWRTSTYDEYVNAAIREATTPNGVFGAKVMSGYMNDFLHRLAATRPGEELHGHRLLTEWFPNLRYVRASRRDRIAQAVSWARAIQSDVWYAGDSRRSAVPSSSTSSRSTIS